METPRQALNFIEDGFKTYSSELVLISYISDPDLPNATGVIVFTISACQRDANNGTLQVDLIRIHHDGQLFHPINLSYEMLRNIR